LFPLSTFLSHCWTHYPSHHPLSFSHGKFVIMTHCMCNEYLLINFQLNLRFNIFLCNLRIVM
jgi:hypothetical protein